jgi:hypothetical protein
VGRLRQEGGLNKVMTQVGEKFPVVILCKECRRVLNGKKWEPSGALPWYVEKVPGILCPECVARQWRRRRTA